jgi:hypothetical protein
MAKEYPLQYQSPARLVVLLACGTVTAARPQTFAGRQRPNKESSSFISERFLDEILR